LDPLAAADVREADPAHLLLVAEWCGEREQLLRAQVGPTDVERRLEVCGWLQRLRTPSGASGRHARRRGKGGTREVICVAQIEDGAVVERWSFG